MRKELEKCENAEGVIIFNSWSGAAGTGLAYNLL
jgi:hypothetical protein